MDVESPDNTIAKWHPETKRGFDFKEISEAGFLYKTSDHTGQIIHEPLPGTSTDDHFVIKNQTGKRLILTFSLLRLNGSKDGPYLPGQTLNDNNIIDYGPSVVGRAIIDHGAKWELKRKFYTFCVRILEPGWKTPVSGDLDHMNLLAPPTLESYAELGKVYVQSGGIVLIFTDRKGVATYVVSRRINDPALKFCSDVMMNNWAPTYGGVTAK